MPALPTVTLDRVAKRYGWRGPWVLRDVNLEIPAGSLTLLSGLNGSGKTTLLRIVAGLSAPTHGVVREVQSVAVVPDRFVPPARMTGRSYLGHQGRVRGLTTPEANRRADELAARLGVRPGLDVALQDLSKGNAQKVALAQAFLAPVGLLALDEPRTAIDPQAVEALDDLLAEARERGTAVVVSDPAAAASYSGAARYQLESGRPRLLDGVEPSAAGWVAIRLRPVADGGGTAPAFVRLAATWSLDPDGAITLEVDPGRSDDVLRRALDEGWSVVDVHRLSAAGRRPPVDEPTRTSRRGRGGGG